MRAFLLLAALAALSACGNNDQKDNTQNVGENLTAENIVSNDVTAIDAVTGDAANMAADVDMNYGNLAEPNAEAATNQPAAKPAPKRPREGSLSPAPQPATTTASNSTTNSQ